MGSVRAVILNRILFSRPLEIVECSKEKKKVVIKKNLFPSLSKWDVGQFSLGVHEMARLALEWQAGMGSTGEADNQAWKAVLDSPTLP